MTWLGRVLCLFGLHRLRWCRTTPGFYERHARGDHHDALLIQVDLAFSRLWCECARCGKWLAG